MSEKYFHEFGPILKSILIANGYEEAPYTAGGLGMARDFKKGEITISLLYDLRDNLVILQRLVGRKRTHILYEEQFHQFQAALETWLQSDTSLV